MKRALRRMLGTILVIVLALGVGTFVPHPFFGSGRDLSNATGSRRILVLSGQIHTDLAIPLDDETRTEFAFLERTGIPVSNPAAEWLIVGWGGRAFYLETPTWADLKPLPVFKALTIDSSVMHVDLAGQIIEPHPAIRGFDVMPDDFHRLLAFVIASFAEKPDDVMPIVGAGYGAYDRFYEAKGSFNALFGCNTWTAGALRSAGLRTGLWNPVPQTLGVSLKLYN